MYPTWMYIFVSIINVFLRCVWLIRIFTVPVNSETLFFIQNFIQVNRRILWFVFRVENEYLNNPEKYRKFKEVPEMTGHNPNQNNENNK
jgi:hypothetical protein